MPIARVPIVACKLWQAAQKLLKQGYMNLAYRMKDTDGELLLVVPSINMIKEHMPDTCDTMEKKRAFLKTWANEFKAARKNPDGAHCMHA